MTIENLGQLLQSFEGAGTFELYFKRLAPNDVSKNQVYFGPGFQPLNIFPHRGVAGEKTPKAKVDFWWMSDQGTLCNAPGAQLILYPQYPEVRFSGFLRGCRDAPNSLMTSRDEGRMLFLGVTRDRKVVGYVLPAGHPILAAVDSLTNTEQVGVFYRINLVASDQQVLLRKLKEIYLKGWIPSKRLDTNGTEVDCKSPNCGGYTLEAELGITPNGIPLPDYLGYEVKQYAVTNFTNANAKGVLTLMTPEPTGGYYKEYGPEAFVRRFGYPDTAGRIDRLNFGGIYRYGTVAARTGLTLGLTGYDLVSGKTDMQNGGIVLTNSDGETAASWDFSSLIKHWSQKHARAVYVPSMSRKSPREYHYAPEVYLGIDTDFELLLKAIVREEVFYDPAVKVENASTRPNVKRRNQFRIKPSSLHSLYYRWSAQDLKSIH